MIKIVEYIHSKQIIHCDIKPDNFMISQDGDIILIDFGLSEHYQDFSYHYIITLSVKQVLKQDFGN